MSSRARPEAIEALRELLSLPTPRRQALDLEGLFTEIWDERFTGKKFETSVGTWPAADLAAQVTLHLGSVLSGVRVDRRTRAWDAYERFFKVLFRDSRSLSIITFNYDTVVEQVLSQLRKTYSYGPRGAIRFVDRSRSRKLEGHDPDARILKLHGSVNWGLCVKCDEAPRNGSLVNAFEDPYVPPRRRPCEFCGAEYLAPAIIPPVATKGGALEPLSRIWQQAREVLRRSREVYVIGYSLPLGDMQATDLLSEVFQEGKRPRVAVVSPSENLRFDAIFPKFRFVQRRFEDFVE